MEISNSTVYCDEDAVDFMYLNGWKFDNCIFKDLYFDKKGTEDMSNVIYCSNKKMDSKQDFIYTGVPSIDGSYFPDLSYVQFTNSLFLVPKDMWKEKINLFVKSNLSVFDFSGSGVDLKYAPSEPGECALFVMKRDHDNLPFFLESKSLLNCIYKNSRVGRYNLTRTLQNKMQVSLCNIKNSVIWDIFEELVECSSSCLLNMSSTDSFQPYKLRKWLIDQIIENAIDIKIPKFLAKVTLSQLKKFSSFLYEEPHYSKLYPMSATVLLIIESIEEINVENLENQNELLNAYRNEPSQVLTIANSKNLCNLASHLLQIAVPGSDYNTKILIEAEQELNKLSNFNQRDRFLVTQWYELLCHYQNCHDSDEQFPQICRNLEQYHSKSYAIPTSVKEFASSISSFMSLQVKLPKRFDKIIIVFEQGISLDELQKLKEINYKYKTKSQLICIADQII